MQCLPFSILVREFFISLLEVLVETVIYFNMFLIKILPSKLLVVVASSSH